MNFTLADISLAIRYLDCCDTDIWIRVGMALKREYGDSAYEVWTGWSSGDSRFKESEARARWKSFKGSSAKGSVSIGTVMHLAFAAGFKLERPEMSAVEKESFEREQEERRIHLAAQWAREEADIQRWYEVVADACARLIPHLHKVGASPYLGKKKIQGCGALFAPCSFVLEFKPDFTIDIIIGENTKGFFDRNKKNKENNIETVFLFFKRGSILIPLYDGEKSLRNFQIIYNDGKTKRFLTNGQKSGLWYVIGNIRGEEPIIFCEGFATGASLYMATKWPVVVTFDCGNLPVVAAKWSGYGGKRLKIIAGDNDWETALDKNKKNMGIIKAKEAAGACGGNWCVPQFTGDATGLSDFNDLHVSESLQIVCGQLTAAINSVEAPFDRSVVNNNLTPPDYLNIPDAVYDDEFSSVDSPAPSLLDASQNFPSTEINKDQTIDALVNRYALAMPDGKVWDGFQKKLLKKTSYQLSTGKKLFDEWLAHPERRTVQVADVNLEIAAAQAEGGGGLAEALKRYLYISPTSTAWDTVRREPVMLSDLRNAIADCYDGWLKSPERKKREVQKENLVFDPTQQIDAKKHINTYRGLPLVPKHDDDACRNIRHLLWLLCNEDEEIWAWSRKWLAYPLQNVGAKMTTALLFHSVIHGTGKSLFFDGVMREIYGEYHKVIGQAELESQYNSWISKTLFSVGEEILNQSHRYALNGTLKQMITGKKIRINEKYMQSWEESNFMNSVFLSNEQEPMKIEPHDRRYLVIWPLKTLPQEVQIGVAEELRNGGAAAFYDWLLRVDVGDFNEHTKPITTWAKQRLINLGRPAWEVFYDDWKNERLDEPVPYGSCRVMDLYMVYRRWCNRRNENVIGANRFSGYIASEVQRRTDVHYDDGVYKGKSSFFIIGKCPENKTQLQWLGDVVGVWDQNNQKMTEKAA